MVIKTALCNLHLEEKQLLVARSDPTNKYRISERCVYWYKDASLRDANGGWGGLLATKRCIPDGMQQMRPTVALPPMLPV